MSTSSSHALAVASATVVPWSRLPGVAVVDIGPPTGSALVVPGPRTRPVRPYAELWSGPHGVAGRVIQGDGKVAALALRDGEVIPLVAPPLAVVPRSDGVWAMYREGVVAYDRHGAVLHKVAQSGVALLAAPHDAAWLATNEQAWHLGADGSVRGPYGARDALDSFVSGGNLCVRDRSDARMIACVSPSGGASAISLAVALEPFEQPLSLAGDRLVTLQGVTVRLRHGSEVAAWTLQGAGVDAADAGFAVSAADAKLSLWRPTGAPRELPAVGSGSLSAAAVTDHDVTLYSQGAVARHRGTTVDAHKIDEAAYRADVFPQVWTMSPQHAIALGGDAIVVASSGPAGVALLALKLR